MGYFENFKECNAILIAGDGEALTVLSEEFRRLEIPSTPPLILHALSYVRTVGGVELTALPVSMEAGVRRIDVKQPHFSWQHSEEGWLEAAEKIEDLLQARGSGHHWLNCIGIEDASVMVSISEYDDAWWAKRIEESRQGR